MPDRLRVRGWCEDREQEWFVRRLLQKHFGIDGRAIRIEPAPRGRGAAADWVIAQYASARQRARATRHQLNLRFFLMVDADRFGVQQRLQQFRSACCDHEDDDDRVAVIVPAWEIETWVEWLTGQDATEMSKSAMSKASFHAALQKAIASWPDPRPNEEGTVPSLSRARQVFERTFRG